MQLQQLNAPYTCKKKYSNSVLATRNWWQLPAIPTLSEWCPKTWLFRFSDSASAPDRRQMRLRCRGARYVRNLETLVKDVTSTRPSVPLSRDDVDVNRMSASDKTRLVGVRPFRARRSRPDNRPTTAARIVIGLRRDPDSIEWTRRRRIVTALETGTLAVCGHFPTTRVGRAQDVTAIDDGYDACTHHYRSRRRHY